MHPAFWKLCTVVLLVLWLFTSFRSRRTPDIFKPHRRPPHHHSASGGKLGPVGLATYRDNDTWTYDPARDRYNHGLSTQQCESAFPELYPEIDRAVGQWKHRRITPDSIELPISNDGNVRALIHDQQLRIILTRGMQRKDFRHRIISVLSQVAQAITVAEAANEPLPDIEFNVIINDIPLVEGRHDRALWAFTRSFGDEYQESLWLIPDFHFFAPDFPGAQSFRDMQTICRMHDSPVARKKPKAVWRGVTWTNPDLRGDLLKVAQDQPWADVEEMHWDNQSSVIPMDEFCRYAFPVNTEGRSWSARLTHILNCDSVPILHDARWLTHYYHLLSDGDNCVRVERDFSDLGEKVAHFTKHPDEAQKIADNAVSTFRDRYTTPAATSCYWRRLIYSWSTVAFTPESHEPRPNSHDGSVLRGISFEQFVTHKNIEDYPW